MADLTPFGALAPATAMPSILNAVLAHLGLASGSNPSIDPRWAQFAKPGLVEDRRGDAPIDIHEWPRKELMLPNKFDEGNGTMVAFNADTDFAPQPAVPTALSQALGANDIKSPNNSPFGALSR